MKKKLNPIIWQQQFKRLHKSGNNDNLCIILKEDAHINGEKKKGDKEIKKGISEEGGGNGEGDGTGKETVTSRRRR